LYNSPSIIKGIVKRKFGFLTGLPLHFGGNMKTTAFLGLILFFATQAFGQLAPWWIPDVGCQLGLINGSTINSKEPLNLVYLNPDWGDSIIIYYIFNGESDLCRTKMEHVRIGEPNLSTRWDFETPLKILDYPLDTGKTWTTDTRVMVNSNGVWLDYSLTATVIGPQVVDTGIGLLDVIQVTNTYTFEGGNNSSGTFFLHEQLGNVTNLVSLTECTTVATDEISWGNIKALFR
jgi:hypothetical protein